MTECTRMRIFKKKNIYKMGVLFLCKCKVELWQCLLSCDRRSACTGYNCFSSVQLIPSGPRKVHACVWEGVCMCLKHSEWYWQFPWGAWNGNRQMELRFMWPAASRSAYGPDLRTIRGFRDKIRHSAKSCSEIHEAPIYVHWSCSF